MGTTFSTRVRPRLLLTGLFTTLWSGRNQFSLRAADSPVLRICASTPIIADIVGVIGGERIRVASVIPVSADPHTYEATPNDLVALTESDAFVFMGAHLEPFIEAGAWRRAVQEAGIPELEIASRISLIKVDKVIDHGDHTHDLREGDPHVWLDPVKTIEMVDAITAFLSEIDPAGADGYASNAEGYRGELRVLDGEMEEGIARIPVQRRKLIVFHDAFTYFAARFGFEVVGVVLKNPGAEPSAKEIVELQETIDDLGIGVIFAEPQFSTDVLEVIVAETGVTVGELLTDTFAGRVESYLELMRFNLGSLVRHLAMTGE